MGQQKRGAFEPPGPQVPANGFAGFFFVFFTQIIFRVALLRGNFTQRNRILQMGVDIVAACLYRFGKEGVLPAFANPLDEIHIHGAQLPHAERHATHANALLPE